MGQHFPVGRNRFQTIVVVVALALAPTLLGSCGAECSGDTTGYDATIVGTLTALHPATGVFTVESAQSERPPGVATHVPSVGASVAVHYADGQEWFLRVGRRYQVGVSWNGKTFESGVRVADEPCSGGTVYANGSAIDTSRIAWLEVHHVITVVALAPVLLLAAISLWLWRRRRRRPASVRVDDRYL